MTTYEFVRSLLPLVLGVTGTGLSIYNFIDLRRRNSRRLKLLIDTAVPTLSDGTMGDAFLRVTVTNAGHRNVTITNLGIELPGHRTIATMSSYPGIGLQDTLTAATLADGEIATRHFSYRDLSYVTRSLNKGGPTALKPFAVDSAGERHYGAKISFVPEK